MMNQFIPESSLLNHIYIPFYNPPAKRVENCSDFFTYIEPDSRGIMSVINLITDSDQGRAEPVVPFIDLGKFDTETKEWFWMDDSGFPYRIYENSESNGWVLRPQWPINYVGSELSFDPDILIYGADGRELGFYSEASITQNDETVTVRMYPGNPVMMTIDGVVLKDKTIYGNDSLTTGLTSLNSERNPEFYFDSINNKIHTNQNLVGFDPRNIKIYFYESIKEVSVKARLNANAGGTAYYSPTVDYYIVKLNGQYLRG